MLKKKKKNGVKKPIENKDFTKKKIEFFQAGAQ